MAEAWEGGLRRTGVPQDKGDVCQVLREEWVFAGREAGRVLHKEGTCALRREIIWFSRVTVGSSLLEAEGGRCGELWWDRSRRRDRLPCGVGGCGRHPSGRGFSDCLPGRFTGPKMTLSNCYQRFYLFTLLVCSSKRDHSSVQISGKHAVGAGDFIFLQLIASTGQGVPVGLCPHGWLPLGDWKLHCKWHWVIKGKLLNILLISWPLDCLDLVKSLYFKKKTFLLKISCVKWSIWRQVIFFPLR